MGYAVADDPRGSVPAGIEFLDSPSSNSCKRLDQTCKPKIEIKEKDNAGCLP